MHQRLNQPLSLTSNLLLYNDQHAHHWPVKSAVTPSLPGIPSPKRAQLDDVVAKEAWPLSATLLERALPADDTAVWLIRRLDMTLLS
ncbi:MAG: hypothetical protein H6661_02630 [Ardenticatenaceae bacterium]|nr:hypothetical protein [Ardenticatenaceae bacterium]